MLVKPQPWTSLPAPSADRDGSVAALPAEERGRGFSLTSHSFTLNTKLFNLDVSWKRLEVESGDQSKSIARPDRATPTQAQANKTQAEAPSFSEVLKRQQLASLLMDTASPPPGDLETIQDGLNRPSFASSAHRAYQQVSHNGPLGGDRFYKA
jgi:hypothetical protein